MQKKILVVLFITTFLLCVGQSLAAPKSELWQHWTENDPDSALLVDHSIWNRLLKAYLINGPDGITLVRYSRVSTADRTALDHYIRQLTQTAVSRLNRKEQKAFWINLYNALTVKIIL
ncbi:MAG: DUF547 domain-containing protein, partial [Desulfobacterales bacterium]